MNTTWAKDAFIYHIYPLGLCGAPRQNDLAAPREYRLNKLYPWLDHIQSLGANAIYLGPVFQSSSHGYDTVDYYQVDRRLGDNNTLVKFSDTLHERGMRLILDGVFNHVGRDFWAFKDILEKGEESAYCDWFYNLRFGERSPKGDPFQYEGWNGHYSLVKLNLSHLHVRAHLFDAVGMWIEKFKIDGLRLDAADSIDFDFLRALRSFTKSRQTNFWLMGEVVHGDYRQWMNSETLDSVTNYECYKGLYSSLNDANYYEVAYTLNRQFGEEGLYRGSYLYNFVDNHDVDRVASKLDIPAHLYPLYLLLFTMPGIPSVYYGSEWGVEGVKQNWTDEPLRPALNLEKMMVESPYPDLLEAIRRLAALRESNAALRYGTYQQCHVNHTQFAFIRELEDERVVVVLNNAEQPEELNLTLPWKNGTLKDLLESERTFQIQDGRANLILPPIWGRILSVKG
ncbi:MAG: alpha-amylase family glycosyl hydrolase [Chloroflexota bacterium]|jgi:glycosidase|nr:alpha-amylase family glycosyl hydrolase [Chloroflexota bacterium]